MSDIVGRLRSWVHAVDAVPVSDLMDEAADEIESMQEEAVRLNREVSVLISECQTQKDLLVNGTESVSATDEIVRLRRVLMELGSCVRTAETLEEAVASANRHAPLDERAFLWNEFLRIDRMFSSMACETGLGPESDRKCDASQRCRDTGGQPFDSAPVTLTEAEREAVEVALVWVNPERQATLRGLLERTK